MASLLEDALRSGDGGLARGVGSASRQRVRQRFSSEQIEQQKLVVGKRMEAAAEHGGDAKSTRNFVSIAQLWLDFVDDWEIEIDSFAGPTMNDCIRFAMGLRSSRKNLCLGLEEREGRGHAVFLQALYGLPKQVTCKI